MSTMDLYSFTIDIGRKKSMTNLLIEVTPEHRFQQLIEGGKRQGTELISGEIPDGTPRIYVSKFEETLMYKKP